MSQRALISVLILICLKVSVLNAQVPILDPAQTVNTATGEMGFALPLGVVEGVNGHHAPINLNYSAGIQLHQPSSNIGLGFTSLPGVITRQVVLVPDEIKQTSHYTFEQNGFYHIQPWYWVATGILMVATIIIYRCA